MTISVLLFTTERKITISLESLRKRFKVFAEQTQPVIEHYRTIDKLKEVDATKTAEQVADQVSAIIEADNLQK